MNVLNSENIVDSAHPDPKKVTGTQWMFFLLLIFPILALIIILGLIALIGKGIGKIGRGIEWAAASVLLVSIRGMENAIKGSSPKPFRIISEN